MTGRLALTLGLALAAAACGSDPTAPAPPLLVVPAPLPEPAPAPEPGPEPEPEPDPSCAAPARYEAVLEAIWDATTHGNEPPFPLSAHFSRVVGATHLEDVSFWARGDVASPGVEVMAETGGVGTLCQEIRGVSDQGRSSTCISGGEASFPSPGRQRFDFNVDPAQPFVTFVSMIAPSPDWFVGVSGYDLMDEDGCWRDRVRINLIGYDAGTDRGSSFLARNADATPHEPIGLIEELPSDVRTEPFARLILTPLDPPQ